MEKQWILKPVPDAQKVKKLADELEVDEIISILLLQRGVETKEEALKFFNPDLKDLYDPFEMDGMYAAILRIESALEKNEKILVYGDYDVDGTTSVAMVYSFLEHYHKNLDYYIPERYNEGYGVSFKGIDYASQAGVNLIIALDCGIKAVEKINYAREKNIDFIICDHHLPGDTIPDAVAVLNPKKAACKYPFKELSGCGVGFKLLQGYCLHKGIEMSVLYNYLDLVAVSIASDIVPIVGENRILACHGLKKLNVNPCEGLKAIKKTAKIEGLDININDIVFKIGPRINAAGRIRKGTIAVDLLISKSEKEALQKAKGIDVCNDERKDLDQDIFNQALTRVQEDPGAIHKKTTVLYDPDWHKGVVGIVASRLIEYHYKPTIIFTRSNGYITGSARSVEGFDLYKAIDSCSDLLENYGGHMYAAGLTLKPENLATFTQRFEKIVSDSIEPEQLIPRIEIDAELPPDRINERFYRIVERFQPFGPGNMTPVFATFRMFDSGYGRTVGKNHEHLKLDLKHESCPKNLFPSIAFQMGNLVEKVAVSKHFDVCYSIDKNEYMGNTTLQFRIRDIKIQS
jgi:single-stranded-DNA-specific exonuclease